MATKAIGIATPGCGPEVSPPREALRKAAAAADYWALTKPEINFLIAIATFAGFYLASRGNEFPWPLLVDTSVRHGARSRRRWYSESIHRARL